MVAVEARECVEHGLLDGVGVDAVPVAFGGVVAGAGEAGVVAVDLVLAGGAGADHGFAAFRAAHESGELVVGAVGASVGVVLAAFGEQALCFFEGLGVDQGCVAVVHGDLPEGQFADVDPVREDSQDLVGGPGAAGGGAVTSLVEHLGDDLGAQPVVGVQPEDQPHDR